MKILLSQIDPNPHRDLARNPVSEEQVTKLIDSICETGFWNNVVVRPHPDQPGRFQLAYGHNRIEACRRLGMTEVDLPSRDLSDYQMLCAMISENHTQQGTLPPRVVFEDIVAALRLAERLLSSTSTVEEFNNLLKFQTCPVQDESPKWSAIQYGQAKSALSETGGGLGKDFVKRIMPKGTCPNNETLQNTIDSFYSERRRIAAERRAFLVEEARRVALAEKEAFEEQAKLASAQEEAAKGEVEEAGRREREAVDLAAKAKDEKTKQAALKAVDKQQAIRQKAVKRAGRAADEKGRLEKGIEQTQQRIAEETKRAASEKARAEKFADNVISQDLLQRLDSTSKMNDVIKLVKKHKIPKKYHPTLIEKSFGWASDSEASNKALTSISVKGATWWDGITEQSASRIRRLKAEARFRKFMEAYGSIPLEKAAARILGKIHKSIETADQHFTHLAQASEFFDTLSDKDLDKLLEPLTKLKDSHLDYAKQLEAVIKHVGATKKSRVKEINPIHELLQIMVQRDAALAEMDEPIGGHILSIDEVGATASPPPRIEGC